MNGKKWGAIAAAAVVGAMLLGCSASTSETLASLGDGPILKNETGFAPPETLRLCPGIDVANAPASDGDRRILAYSGLFEPKPGVSLAQAPTTGSCLSSGFGPRQGRLHKGVDLQSRPATTIVAAGDGVVLEAHFRDDYGNMVLIDHGRGVYTRYAHLASFAPGVKPGARAAFGAPLGAMGRTARFRVALHLHYEVLLGDIDTPRGSFGLTPIDPLALRRSAGLSD